MTALKSVFILVLVASPLLAQQPLVEKIDVSIVNVDVSVMRDGSPAEGLTLDDFEVFEDGVRQSITNFHYIGSTPQIEPAQPDAEAVSPADERFRRKVLLVVDNRHVTKIRRDRALAALERFIDDDFTGGSYDWSVVLINDRAHLLLPLTSDKAVLHESLADLRQLIANPRQYGGSDVTGFTRVTDWHVKETPPPVLGDKTGKWQDQLESMSARGDQLATEIDASSSVEAVLGAIRSFAGVSGRKIVLLLTGGLGMTDGMEMTGVSRVATHGGRSDAWEAGRNMVLLRDRLIREANAANASLYIIHTEGLSVPAMTGTSFRSMNTPYRSVEAEPELSSLYWIARETGGILMPGNSVEDSLDKFDRTSSSYYSLGYKAPHDDDGKYHSIEVRLKRRGYGLQYRKGYVSLPVSAQLALAMESPIASAMRTSEIPLRLVAGDAKPAGHRDAVIIQLDTLVPTSHLQFIPRDDGSIARVDFMISLFDQQGRKVASDHFTRDARVAAGTELQGELRQTGKYLLKRGKTYQIVVAVHDQVSDAVGISSQTVRF